LPDHAEYPAVSVSRKLLSRNIAEINHVNAISATMVCRLQRARSGDFQPRF
jgi:hypothetical protein